MGEIPEGRKPLTWADMTPKHSSWEAEAKALRALLAQALPLMEEGLSDFWKWDDDGPDGEGWPSDENTTCREALEAWCAEVEKVLGENAAALSELRDQARPTKADAPEQDMPDGFWDGAEMRPAGDKA